MSETDLVLGDLFLPIGSARGVAQTLDLVDNGDLRRTVNGNLVDTTRQVNRKFESTVRVSDMSTPTLAGIWKGMELEVECIQPFRQLVSPADTDATLIREPVSGSVVGYTGAGAKLLPVSVVGQDVTFAAPVTWVQFRPVLQMMVASYSLDDDEYASQETWQVVLEEV